MHLHGSHPQLISSEELSESKSLHPNRLQKLSTSLSRLHTLHASSISMLKGGATPCQEWARQQLVRHRLLIPTEAVH